MNGHESPVARLDNVTHRYGATYALDAVTLAIPSGCMVGLIGPDGVGKSSLLGLIAGARRIQTGRVRVLDGEMANSRHRGLVCARIAYMPQGLGRNLYPDLSVRENIEFFGRLFGQLRDEREWRIGELLNSTGLATFKDRPAKKLSGGMRQKLGLCCALIHDPDLLILDEPTTGVDPLSRRQFWDLIDRMRARRPGMSVIIATAYMEEAERFDWLVAIDAGKVLSAGCSGGNQGGHQVEGRIEEAFIALLPESRRSGQGKFRIPPRKLDDQETVITARDLTFRFGDFTAVDRVSFSIKRGEIFGFLGLERVRKDHDDEDAHGSAARDGGRSVPSGQADRCDRPDARAAAWATCRNHSRSTRSSRSARTSTFTLGFSGFRRTRLQLRIAELVRRFALGPLPRSADFHLASGHAATPFARRRRCTRARDAHP